MINKATDAQVFTIEQLFRLHHPRLCRLAFSVVRDQEVARDLVQDVFFKLLMNQGQLELGDKMGHYLAKATTHAALNYLENSRRRTNITQKLSFATSTEEETFGVTELQERIEQALLTLPPKCQTIFLLSRQEGFTYQQIADMLELSPKTVENQMGIALQKLRQQLKPFLTKEWLAVMGTLVNFSMLECVHWLL